jgi:hypothetical protein
MQLFVFFAHLHNICTIFAQLSLHGNGFQLVIICGTNLILLLKPEAVVRLVPEVEVGFVVLRGINDDHPLFGERNVDVKHADGEADDECRP